MYRFKKLQIIFFLLFIGLTGCIDEVSGKTIYKSSTEDGSGKIIIHEVKIIEEQTDIIEVQINYTFNSKIIGEGTEIWIKPDHSNSEFQWDSINVYSGKNVVNLEIGLRNEELTNNNIESVASSFLKIIISATPDWFEKEIPYKKVWKLKK